MLEKILQNRIIQALPFEPNPEQSTLIRDLSCFMISREEKPVFVLRGYAGTGKTSVVAALVKALGTVQYPVVLLAPTGRAAKVLARYSGEAAYTIHKCIYRQQQLGKDAFCLADNKHYRTLFIVDEASMLSGTRDNPIFGSGSLLDDLVQYVYSGEGCKMLLLGDAAQLPPVGSSKSPALEEDYMRGYGLSCSSFTLTRVARQALDSGILRNATLLREQMEEDMDFSFQAAPDVLLLDGSHFVEQLEHSYHDIGAEETLLLTRTNRRTNLYNQGVRARILWREDALSTGDRIMVTKNNYFFTQNYENLPFLANGDMFEILRLRHEREMYGYHFIDASLRALDYDWEIDTVLWTDTLTTDSPEAHYAMQQELFAKVAEDFPEFAKNRRKLVEAVYNSPYYNALQVRFAYAVTCHKAQGGQWKHVFIDPGNRPETESQTDYHRWLYTAITRATEKVFILQS